MIHKKIRPGKCRICLTPQPISEKRTAFRFFYSLCIKPQTLSTCITIHVLLRFRDGVTQLHFIIFQPTLFARVILLKKLVCFCYFQESFSQFIITLCFIQVRMTKLCRCEISGNEQQKYESLSKLNYILHGTTHGKIL